MKYGIVGEEVFLRKWSTGLGGGSVPVPVEHRMVGRKCFCASGARDGGEEVFLCQWSTGWWGGSVPV